MATTKPDTETGWSKEFPKEDGYYWWVISGEVRLLEIIHSANEAWTEGDDKNQWDKAYYWTGKFLGPISPSNFEQLIRLREAAALCAIPYEALLADSKSKEWIAPKVWTAIENAVDALREALTSVNNLRDGKPPH